MGPVEALKYALSRELESITVYAKLGIDHRELKDTFDFLITEEEKHKQLLEKKIEQLTKY